MSELVFECGILLCGNVREFLSLIALRHPEVRWHESRGWFIRTFVVVAPASDIQMIAGQLQQWIDINQLNTPHIHSGHDYR